MSATANTEVIAMHGWAGDSRAWAPWAELARQRGWTLHGGERGYGALPPTMPRWSASSRQRVLLTHSLGPHLLPASLWCEATAAVLLCGFTTFVPPGRTGRAVAAGLRGMATQLEAGDAAMAAMLTTFFDKVADPSPASQLPQGPLQQGISAEGRQRLRQDLDRLTHCSGLPEGLPADIPVLLVEAQDDRIVTPASRALLRQALPGATVWSLERAGHGLLAAQGLLPAVLEWMGNGRA
jgi:pimeloyl-[acyl-carrier protein] methyl ester esterase